MRHVCMCGSCHSHCSSDSSDSSTFRAGCCHMSPLLPPLYLQWYSHDIRTYSHYLPMISPWLHPHPPISSLAPPVASSSCIDTAPNRHTWSPTLRPAAAAGDASLTSSMVALAAEPFEPFCPSKLISKASTNNRNQQISIIQQEIVLETKKDWYTITCPIRSDNITSDDQTNTE